MDFSTELLQKICDCGQRMMTPKETAFYLELDENELQDEINSQGTPARKYYLKGVMNTVYEMRQGLFDAASAGSPYALTQCKELILKTMTESQF